MKSIVIWSALLIMMSAISSCGQDGAAVAPGANGSTIADVKADCNGQPCL